MTEQEKLRDAVCHGLITLSARAPNWPQIGDVWINTKSVLRIWDGTRWVTALESLRTD